LLATALVLGTALSTWQAIRATWARDAEREVRVALGDALEQAYVNEEAAKTQKALAKQQEKLAKAEELIARRRFYAAQMNLAQQAWEAGDPGRVLELLETQRPRFDEDDLRTFEWYYLWRLCHLQHRFTLRGHKSAIYGLAFSPDGTLLASSEHHGVARLWDPASGRERGTLLGDGHGWGVLAFSPDGKIVALGSGTSPTATVSLWDVATHRKLGVLQRTGMVRCLAFSPDGKTLVTGCDGDNTVTFWNVATRQKQASFAPATHGVVLCLAYSPDGRTLATACGFGQPLMLKLWDVTVQPPRLLHELPSAERVAFSPDGKMIATGGYGRVELRDVATGKEQRSYVGGPGEGNALAFAPDGKTLAVGTHYRSIILWDLVTGQKRSLPHQGAIRVLAFSPNGKTLASGGEDCTIKVWDLAPKPEALSLEHTAGVIATAFSPDNKTLAVSSPDGTIKLWEADTGKERATLRGPRGDAGELVFSPDGQTLASTHASWEGKNPEEAPDEVRLWDVATGREVGPVNQKPLKGWCAAFSPDGKTLVTGAQDGTIRLWDVASRELRASLRESPRIRAVAFSPDGKVLASGDHFGAVKLRHPATGQAKATIQEGMGPYYEFSSLVFSPNGNLLATGDSNGTVKLWDPATGQPRGSLRGHTAVIAFMAFFPDGQTLVTSSADGRVKLWDVVTGQERITLKDGAYYFAVAPDGKTLAVQSGGSMVRLWRAATDKEAVAFKTELETDDPRNPAAQNLAGDRLLAAGRIDEAVAAYRQARSRLEKLTARFPSIPDYQEEWARSCFALGVLLSETPLPEEAKQALGQAAILAEKLPADCQRTLAQRYSDLGRSLRAAGRTQQAERAQRQASELQTKLQAATKPELEPAKPTEKAGANLPKSVGQDPPELSTWKQRGAEHLKQGQWEKAALDYSKAMELNPKDWWLWHERGYAYLMLRQFDKAVADHSKAIELNPNDWELWARRGEAYLKLGHCEKAVLDYSKAIELKPDDWLLWRERGYAYLMLRQFDKAVADHSKAIELNPNDWGLWDRRAQAYLELEQRDKASADLAKAIELKPDEAMVHYWLALARAGTGDLAGYRSACAAMLEQFGKTEKPEEGHWVAWAAVLAPDAVKDPHRPVKLAELAVRSDPRESWYLSTHGAALYRAGRFAEAVQRLQEASTQWDKAATKPTQSSPAYTWFFLAMAHQRLGHIEEARRWLEKAVTWMEQETQGNTVAWNRRQTLQLLRREAEALLKQPAPVKRNDKPE
jgi:WD40 repeat protein/Flp pilus assembly protein TadD